MPRSEPVTPAAAGARFLEVPHPDFAESIPGLLVAELDALPHDALDLLEVVREVEGGAS
jgi:hypothetical protein